MHANVAIIIFVLFLKLKALGLLVISVDCLPLLALVALALVGPVFSLVGPPSSKEATPAS